MSVEKIPVQTSVSAPRAHDEGYAPRSGCPLITSIEATHELVLRELASEEPNAAFRAVALLSGHLAAMRLVVYRTAHRAPAEAGRLLGSCLRAARELDWAARLLQCWLSGDMFATGMAADAVAGSLQQSLARYTLAERALIDHLQRQLPERSRDALAASYRNALAHAPTRPHPRRPHAGAAYPALFRLHRMWDGLLDTVDSRPGTGRSLSPPA